ncbi:Arf-GAP with coiled-coil, ANK repeat and PH domain-containing protein 2 [Armadillidium vulgare]|nr:Arf-GAP with coiled-coil, ANK repeat and PH domain-containing protein 2 [Armadillidium vulgare]
MRDEVADLERSMENRHYEISGKALVSENVNRNSCFPITMQGYLFKRTNNAFKSWNRRYFTLQNNQLVYRKRSGEEVTVMEDDLRLCSVKPAVDMERRFCFEITSNVKSHMLQAESEESCQLWIEAMSRAISSAIQNNEYSYNLIQGSNDSPVNLSTSSLSPSPADSPCPNKQSDKSESSSSSVWKEIMKIPGNNVCCDCGSPDPKWASINLGITLCIDKWDVEVLRVMEKLGNDIVNQIYLSNRKRAESVFHTNIDGTSIQNITPATPECARSVREAWIKAKYMDKLFVTPISNEKAFAKILNHSKSFGQRQKTKKGKSNVSSSDSLEVLNSPSSPAMLSDSSSSSSLDPGERLSPSDVPSNRGLPQTDWTKMISENALRMESLTPNHLLLTASSLGHIPLMCLSFALGAQKNFQDHDGKTPLHHSVSSRSAIAVEYLLLNGVQANIEDQNGRTALHLASIEANILQVYRLIKYRADWKVKDKDGKTPVDYAVQSSEPDLVTLLRVATLSEQLDKEQVEDDMMTIMQDLYRKKNHLLEESEDWTT